MPKEFFYGSDKSIPGYGLIYASADASQEERNWVSENSVYTRIGSKEESPVSWAFSLSGGLPFVSQSVPATDYSGRASFAAHYLELSQEETLFYEDGPFHLLERYRFLPGGRERSELERNTWQRIVRFDTRRSEHLLCNTWQSILGERGPQYAACAAAVILRGDSMVIYYEAYQKDLIFSLFREVWALLPAVYRWERTFNTYLSNLGTVYSLNGVLKNSDVCTQLSRMTESIYLDISTGENVLPSEILEQHGLYGLETGLFTGVPVPQSYGAVPETPLRAAAAWETQQSLLQKLCEEGEKVRAELEKVLRDERAQVKEHREIAAVWRSQKESLRAKWDELNRNVEQKTAERDGLTREILNKKSEYDHLTQEIEQKTAERNGLTQEIEQKTAERDRWDQAISQNRMAISRQKEEYNKQKEEYNKLVKEKEDLESQKTQLESGNQSLDTQKTQLEKDVQSLGTQKMELENGNQSLGTQKSELESEIKEKGQKCKELDQRIHQVEKLLENWNAFRTSFENVWNPLEKHTEEKSEQES